MKTNVPVEPPQPFFGRSLGLGLYSKGEEELLFFVNSPVIERFFRDLTDKRIRRGSFTSVDELKKAIFDYIEHHNQSPVPFVWTAQADKILEKVGRARLALNKLRTD